MVYVIGSLSQEDEIREVAEYFEKESPYDVVYVMKEPERPLQDLINECFSLISVFSYVVAVPKKGGTYGTGVTYEIAFAKFIGKPVIKVTKKDIKRKRKKFKFI